VGDKVWLIINNHHNGRRRIDLGNVTSVE
jgi:hypothetical protein